MKDVLRITINAYKKNIAEQAQVPIDKQLMMRYLPTAKKSDLAHLKKATEALPILAMAFVSFVEDTDRLPQDRMLAVAALNYLIMPFDAISDTEENGALALMDDAIIIIEVASRMQCLSPELTKLVIQVKPSTDALRNAMPDWLGKTMDQYFANLTISAKIS